MIEKELFVAIEFDGCIVTHDYPEIGEKVPFVKESIDAFRASGLKTILLTSREGDALQKAVDHLNRYDMMTDFVNENPTIKCKNKLFAHVYVDPAAVGIPTIMHPCNSSRCVDWLSVLLMIERRLSVKLVERYELVNDRQMPGMYNNSNGNSVRRQSIRATYPFKRMASPSIVHFVPLVDGTFACFNEHAIEGISDLKTLNVNELFEEYGLDMRSYNKL